MRIKMKYLTIVMTLSFTWLGVFSNFISTHIGGIGFFATELLLLVLSAYPGVISIRLERIKIYKSLLAFILFLVLFALGIQLFFTGGVFKEIAGVRLSSHTYDIIINFPLWIASYLFLIKSNNEDHIFMIKILYVFLFYDVVITLIALFVIPDYARNSAAMISSTGMKLFKTLGAMGYELTFSLAILIPLMFAYGRKTKQKRWFILAAFSILLVLKSIFFLGIISLILNTVLSYVLGQKRKIIRIVLVICLIVISVFSILNISSVGIWMISIGNSMNENDLRRRMIQIGYSLAYNNNSGDSLVRIDLYLKALRGIGTHPILGNLIFKSNESISGHSTILDVWSGLGIIPFISFIYSIIMALQYSLASFCDKSWNRICVSSVVTFIFIATFDPVLSGPNIISAILFVVPLISCVLGISTQEVKEIGE